MMGPARRKNLVKGGLKSALLHKIQVMMEKEKEIENE